MSSVIPPAFLPKKVLPRFDAQEVCSHLRLKLVDPAPRDTAAAAALLELCKSGKKEIEEIGRLVREETKKQHGKIVFGRFCNGLVVLDRARATTPCTVVVMTLCPIVSRSLSHAIGLLVQITKPNNPQYLLHDRRSSLSLTLFLSTKTSRPDSRFGKKALAATPDISDKPNPLRHSFSASLLHCASGPRVKKSR
jgi:hypothetical protein